MNAERVTEVAQVKPGMEIEFSDEPFVNHPHPEYDPTTVSLFRRGPRPGTIRLGIVIMVTVNRGVMVKQITGFQRGTKRWIPFARVWALTGEQHPVPNPKYLRWYDAELEAEWRANQRAEMWE